jgi:hypothetical protein
MIICVDFDGTMVDHRYPEIGKNVPYAVEYLKGLIANGHSIILWTMRSGEELEQAADWMRDRGIVLYGVNENPTQHKWTQSPKAYGQLYIDDAACGCPLIKLPGFARPCVDWSAISKMIGE